MCSREEAKAKSKSERAKAKANLHVVRVRSDVFFRKDSSDAQRAQVEARVQAEPVASRDGSASFGGAVGYESACVRCEPYRASRTVAARAALKAIHRLYRLLFLPLLNLGPLVWRLNHCQIRTYVRAWVRAWFRWGLV